MSAPRSEPGHKSMHPRHDAEPCTYWLDEEDRITRVNAAWAAFATANGVPELPAAALGRPLWDFVANPQLRQLLHELFTAVRRSGNAARLPYRCDSPTLRRLFTLRLRPAPDGTLECASDLVAEVPRATGPLLDPAASHSDDVLVVCSWCKRAKLDDWVELDIAARRLRLLAAPAVPTLSHGICPDCERELRAATASAPSTGSSPGQ